MITVLLVDDHALVRGGLRTLIEAEADMEVVGEAGDGLEALDVLAQLAPDVALIDARMPRMDGVALIEQITTDHPLVQTVLLTTFDQEEYVFGALRAGARGHFLKDTDPDDLLAGIRRAADGQSVLGEAATDRLIAHLRHEPLTNSFDGVEHLTERELDISRQVAAGLSNREIAQAQHITEGTVKNHVSAALRKLGLADRTQLALRVSGRAVD